MRRRSWLYLLGVLCLAAATASEARAEEPGPAPSDWDFTGGLYGWGIWLDGTITARGETFSAYADPVQLIDALDGPIIMANFEATHGKFSFYADVIYAEFALDQDFLGEAEPIPALQLTGDARIGSELDFGIYQAEAFYEVANFVGAKGGKTSIEFGAGARYVELDLQVRAKIDLNAQVRLGRLADRIENSIRRIENRDQRLESLEALNALRAKVLEERIVRAKDKGRDRLVARLERQLERVDERGEALAALEALDKLELELLRAALNLNGREFNNEFATVSTGNMDWVDPVIAMRVTHDLGQGRSITAMGDFGGFNINEGLSWQAILTYDYEGMLFGFQTTTSIGYKALWLEFEEDTSNGTRGLDIVLHGPIAELAFRW